MNDTGCALDSAWARAVASIAGSRSIPVTDPARPTSSAFKEGHRPGAAADVEHGHAVGDPSFSQHLPGAGLEKLCQFVQPRDLSCRAAEHVAACRMGRPVHDCSSMACANRMSAAESWAAGRGLRRFRLASRGPRRTPLRVAGC